MERMMGRALKANSRRFSAAYATNGRPGVAPEVLLKALVPQCLYSLRSERDMCRRFRADMLFRWFPETEPDAAVFDHAVFPHNKKRPEEHDRRSTS
jgi:transposase